MGMTLQWRLCCNCSGRYGPLSLLLLSDVHQCFQWHQNSLGMVAHQCFLTLSKICWVLWKCVCRRKVYRIKIPMDFCFCPCVNCYYNGTSDLVLQFRIDILWNNHILTIMEQGIRLYLGRFTMIGFMHHVQMGEKDGKYFSCKKMACCN